MNRKSRLVLKRIFEIGKKGNRVSMFNHSFWLMSKLMEFLLGGHRIVFVNTVDGSFKSGKQSLKLNWKLFMLIIFSKNKLHSSKDSKDLNFRRKKSYRDHLWELKKSLLHRIQFWSVFFWGYLLVWIIEAIIIKKVSWSEHEKEIKYANVDERSRKCLFFSSRDVEALFA